MYKIGWHEVRKQSTMIGEVGRYRLQTKYKGCREVAAALRYEEINTK